MNDDLSFDLAISNMLSKLLNSFEGEVKPLVWRTGPVAELTPKHRDSGEGDLSREVFRLRAHAAELTTMLEQQARQAYESGFQAADAAARQSAAAEIHVNVEKLAATIADVASTRSEIIRRAESDTVRLALQIAKRILHRELSIDPFALEGLVRAALAKLQAHEVYRVRVHPDQEKIVRKCLDEMGRKQSIEVISDPCQPRGGAIFEISRGNLDASVETQLAEIEHGLFDQLESRT